MGYPLEALLRPAYELRAAAASSFAAAAVMTSPATFLLTPELAWGLAGVFVCHAAWRGYAGLRIIKYRSNLRRQHRYVVASDEIPWSAERLFLGRGFRWDQRHTQRLHEARLPEKRDLLRPGLIGRIAESLRLQSGRAIRRAAATRRSTASSRRRSDIWMNLGERVGHTLVLGTTRVGKTRLAELLIAQDIRRGEVVIVFDPKGDIDLLRRVYAEAKRAGREEDFFLFHLGHPEISARYNPVGSFSRITEVATRIAGQLPSEGQSAAFKEFVWRFVNVMARALVALGRKPDYAQINRHAADIEPLLIDYFEHWLDREPAARGWREEVESMAIDKKSLDKGLQSRGIPRRDAGRVRPAQASSTTRSPHALASTLNYEKSYFDKLVASLLPLMEKLTTGPHRGAALAGLRRSGRLAAGVRLALGDQPAAPSSTSGWTPCPTTRWPQRWATPCSPT